MFGRLLDAYPDDIQIVYCHFPLTHIHDNAQKAAEASEAAGAQDAFWEYHDELFATQAEWSGLSQAQAREFFIDLARELELDVQQFTTDLDGNVYAGAVSAQAEEAQALGMPGTPAVIYDEQLLAGDTLPPSYFIWDALVQLDLLQERQYEAPPSLAVDTDATYLATVTMESGQEFVIELLSQSAPQTVNNFIFLAREGWFDGVTFHRVLPGFVAQTGDPTGTGIGGPGYTIPNEIDPDLSHDEPGIVAMANAGPDTNGSQWYITLADVQQLDGSYTIFGRVIKGMDVVQGLTPRDPAQNPTAPPGDKIVSITIEEQ